MDLVGKIKILNGTQTLGDKGFRKREVVITTEEQYPQHILVEFIQDKCDLLNNYSIGQEVKIDINIRGREWINPEGVAKYFNAIHGWRIELLNKEQDKKLNKPLEKEPLSFLEEEHDGDLPF